eukprot:m.61394 g.61394  ORF g.61394 m.61394 type:complete len:157 (+) comp35004_c0_seq2:428-898(+)
MTRIECRLKPSRPPSPANKRDNKEKKLRFVSGSRSTLRQFSNMSMASSIRKATAAPARVRRTSNKRLSGDEAIQFKCRSWKRKGFAELVVHTQKWTVSSLSNPLKVSRNTPGKVAGPRNGLTRRQDLPRRVQPDDIKVSDSCINKLLQHSLIFTCS